MQRLLLLWLAGIDLRLTVLVIPPLLPLIHRDLHLDEKSIGALTGLPVLLLAAAAVPGSLLVTKLGARQTLVCGLLVIALSSALRGAYPSAPFLFSMTVLMGAGIAVIQPAFPTLVREWCAENVGLATAAYANGLLAGEALSSALTIPFVLPLAGGSWQRSCALWALPVLATALAVHAFAPHAARPAEDPPVLWWPDWASVRTWQLGLVFAGASTIYFGLNAFLPDFLHASGRPALVAAALTSLNASQLPASVLVGLFPRQLVGRQSPLVGVGALSAAGVLGLLLTPGAWVVFWSGLLGFCAAFVFVLMLALPPLLAEARDVHRFSAAVFTITYTCSFLGPLLGGIAWDASGVPATAFLPVATGAAAILFIPALLKLPRSQPARFG